MQTSLTSSQILLMEHEEKRYQATAFGIENWMTSDQ